MCVHDSLAPGSRGDAHREAIATTLSVLARCCSSGAFRARRALRGTNASIRMSRGSYLRFVNADDIFEPGSTGRMLAVDEGSGALAMMPR